MGDDRMANRISNTDAVKLGANHAHRVTRLGYDCVPERRSLIAALAAAGADDDQACMSIDGFNSTVACWFAAASANDAIDQRHDYRDIDHVAGEYLRNVRDTLNGWGLEDHQSRAATVFTLRIAKLRPAADAADAADAARTAAADAADAADAAERAADAAKRAADAADACAAADGRSRCAAANAADAAKHASYAADAAKRAADAPNAAAAIAAASDAAAASIGAADAADAADAAAADAADVAAA